MSFVKYQQKLSNPSLERKYTKYYEEMQQLAYNLVRYLKMNEIQEENAYQGNYNLTYLVENMTKDDFYFIVAKMLRKIPNKDLKELIINNFSKDSCQFLFTLNNLNQHEEEYLKDILTDIKNSLIVDREYIDKANAIYNKLFQ